MRLRFKPKAAVLHLKAMDYTPTLDSALLRQLDLAEPQRWNAEESPHIRAASTGCAKAFASLYRAHLSRVYSLCWRLSGGDSIKADQLTQDAFVRAWEKLASFRFESSFSTWLHRLTVNVVLGEQRTLKRWISLEDIDEAEFLDGQDLPHTGWSDCLDVERALARLPPGARAVLLLHDVEGFQHDEIANLTGIAVGTSKAQLHRARKLMRGWLT